MTVLKKKKKIVVPQEFYFVMLALQIDRENSDTE